MNKEQKENKTNEIQSTVLIIMTICSIITLIALLYMEKIPSENYELIHIQDKELISILLEEQNQQYYVLKEEKETLHFLTNINGIPNMEKVSPITFTTEEVGSEKPYVAIYEREYNGFFRNQMTPTEKEYHFYIPNETFLDKTLISTP